MLEKQINSKAKLAVKRALSQPSISGQDLKAIIEHQYKHLIIPTGEHLEDYHLSVLGAYMIQCN